VGVPGGIDNMSLGTSGAKRSRREHPQVRPFARGRAHSADRLFSEQVRLYQRWWT
jgi:hypothetical protein